MSTQNIFLREKYLFNTISHSSWLLIFKINDIKREYWCFKKTFAVSTIPECNNWKYFVQQLCSEVWKWNKFWNWQKKTFNLTSSFERIFFFSFKFCSFSCKNYRLSSQSQLPCVHSPETLWSPSPMSPELHRPATAWGSFHPAWSTSLHKPLCRWALCSRALTRNAPQPGDASARWFWCSPWKKCCSCWKDAWIAQTRRCRKSGDLFLQLQLLAGFSNHVHPFLRFKYKYRERDYKISL